MAKPKAFISSTFLDLKDTRDFVNDYLKSNDFETKLFEKGGVFYDPTKPLDESCYDEVKDSDIFILILAGRYGSPATGEKNKATYMSITKKEYLTAKTENIPIYTFVKREVLTEYLTYQKQKNNKSLNYAHVDSTNVFKVIDDIYAMQLNNSIYSFENATDIVAKLKSQLAGMWSVYLRNKKRGQKKLPEVRINAYKMFFYRTYKENISFGELSKRTGIEKSQLRNLETIMQHKFDHLENSLFKVCEEQIIEKIEVALNCKGNLTVGKNDDFLSRYMQYYSTYKGKKPTTSRSLSSQAELFPTKAIVFDFDGTLTYEDKRHTTWEKIWIELGYSINECISLLGQFSDKKIDHKAWCEMTCSNFQKGNLDEILLNKIASEIQLLGGVKDVIKLLHSKGIKIFILSGSIRQIIKIVLSDVYDLFDEVKANDLIFTKGKLTKIRGTIYDFEGKATYLKELIKNNQISPLEVLFVGNSYNDAWASQSGARTLCINPDFTDYNNQEQWTYCIRETDNLKSILDYVTIS